MRSKEASNPTYISTITSIAVHVGRGLAAQLALKPCLTCSHTIAYHQMNSLHNFYAVLEPLGLAQHSMTWSRHSSGQLVLAEPRRLSVASWNSNHMRYMQQQSLFTPKGVNLGLNSLMYIWYFE